VILGLALAIGLAFARERLDERVGGRKELEQDLRAPVIALVPKAPGQRGGNETRLITISAPTGGAAEAYRTARTTLLYLAKEGGIQVILVTGPGQGEGKTTTTANLGVTLAQSGKHVIVVSCDLRRPRLHRYFDQPNGNGLSDVLTGKVDIPTAIRKTSVPGLLMISSGHLPSNPAELLASEVMDDFLDELRKVADFVLLDTPPSLVVSDALGLAPKADGSGFLRLRQRCGKRPPSRSA